MADTTMKKILSVCATVGARLSDLPFKEGQMIFVQDKHRIAFDYKDKRVFYNQIEELATEEERKAMLAPVTGLYYFVIDTATLWTYRIIQDGEYPKWIQLTTPPRDILFIGTQLPELGAGNTLYVDTENKEIAIWDETLSAYVVVADRTKEFSADDIDALFNKH